MFDDIFPLLYFPEFAPARWNKDWFGVGLGHEEGLYYVDDVDCPAGSATAFSDTPSLQHCQLGHLFS